MFGPLGAPEIIFIVVLALLIFGPRRLPEMGRTLGKAMGEFRRATTELKRSINTEIALEDEEDRPRYSRSGRDGGTDGKRPARQAVENPDDEFVVTTEGLISPRQAAARDSVPAARPGGDAGDGGGTGGQEGAAGAADGGAGRSGEAATDGGDRSGDASSSAAGAQPGTVPRGKAARQDGGDAATERAGTGGSEGDSGSAADGGERAGSRTDREER